MVWADSNNGGQIFAADPTPGADIAAVSLCILENSVDVAYRITGRNLFLSPKVVLNWATMQGGNVQVIAEAFSGKLDPRKGDHTDSIPITDLKPSPSGTVPTHLQVVIDPPIPETDHGRILETEEGNNVIPFLRYHTSWKMG